MTIVGAVFLALAQDEDKSHPKVYARAVDSVVAVRSLATLGERSGTGIILDAEGLILTSYSVVPEEAENIRVYLHGPRLLKGEIVAASKKDELTLLRVKSDRKLRPASLGQSAKLKIGQVCYTLGNAVNSFINDDQPAFNMGIVSGLYNLREAKQNSFYTGYVFETTAAVNWGMEGAPLLDGTGDVVGVITLNYSPSRWLGNAIPIDAVKPRIRQLLEAAKKAEVAVEQEGEGWLGFTVKADGKKIVIEKVDPRGPAAAQGLQAGDVIESIGEKRLQTLEDFFSMTQALKAGSIVWIRLSTSDKVKLEVSARPK